jgi:hypothetical protein
MGDTVQTRTATTPAQDTADQWTAGFLKMDRPALRRANAIGGARMSASSPPTRTPPPVPPRPRAEERTKGAIVTAQVQAATGPAVLAGLPDSDAANQIRDIVAQHAKCVPSEIAAFKSVEYLDDLARIGNSDDRSAKLKKISDVLAAVDKRRQELRTALKQFPAPQPETATKSISAGWLCFQSIADHLPDAFQRMNGAMAAQRINTLMASKEEKEAILAEARSGFKDDDGNDISATLGDTFKGVIEPVSTKAFERQNFYFDQFVSSPPQDQIKQLIEVTDKIVAQGQKILDAGGKLRDVEALMAKTGIPKDWWPPQFVDTLQAWRKTERAMAQERVSNQFAKKAEEGVDMTTPQGFTDFFCSTVPDNADGISKVMHDPDVLESVNQFMQGLSTGYGLGSLGLTALQTLKFDELPKTDAQKLKDGIETSMKLVASAVDTTISALNLATSVGAHILSHVVPGLSLVSCGIKLGLAVKKLGEHTALRVQTGMMKDDALKALGNASMEDGGAFLNALDNEVNGRNKQIGKDGIEVFAASMDLAGSAAGSFGGHHGLVAQGALKITSTAITLGSKFVFTNIDWAQARKAKALLTEAQAGNPVARMEIFKNSNLYAKMYICVLCQEGNPLAKKFVIQRGIEEEDLDGAMSTKILRDALLQSADQKDENDIEDNWLLENAGTVGKGLVKAGKAISGATGAINDLRKNRDTAYDPNWVPKADIALTEAAWKEIKAGAIKAGLYDEATGIGEALGKAEKKLAKADETIAAIKGKTLQPTTKEGQAAQKLLLETVAALDAAYAAAYSCSPMSNPTGKPAKSEVHKGMTLYLAKLLEVIGARRTEVETALRDCGLKKVGWQPGMGADPLDPTIWGVNWQSGVTNACLSESDSGLGKSLTASAKAKADYETAEGTKRREAALAYSEALNDVVAVGKACLGQVGEVQGMAKYVQEIVKKAGTDRVALDKVLGADDWKPIIPEIGSITSAAWQTLWAEAVKAGHVSTKAGDGGVLDAIKDMEKLAKAVEAAKDGKPKLKARMEYAKAVGKILLAKEAFLKAQRDVGNPLKQFVDNAYKQAQAVQNGYQEARSKVAFTTTPGITAAAWEATYKDAVDTAAVPAAKGAASAFSDALKEYASSKADLDKAMAGKKYKDALKFAHEVTEKINDALAAIDTKLMVSDGYEKNAAMNAYLTKQRADVKALLDNPVLVRALAGDAAGAEFKAPAFTLDKDVFSKVKDTAIKLGVISDQKTGMQAALVNCAKSAAALTKAKAAKPPVPEVVKKATEAALADAQVLRSTAARLRQLSKNANWDTYAESAVVAATNYQKRLM